MIPRPSAFERSRRDEGSVKRRNGSSSMTSISFLRVGGALLALCFASVAAASCANGATVTGLDCTPDQTICDTACADLKSDTENCGKCGNLCPSAQLCVNGVCALQCPGADTVCGGDGGKSGRCVN